MPTAARTMPRLREEIERVVTPYNDIVARRVGERVDLDVEGATFATWHPRHLLTGYSWDALTAACLLHEGGPPKRVLLLGLGGGTMLRQLKALVPELVAVAVEIDALVVDLARKHMELDKLGAEIVIDDAYAFIERSSERFDVVVDDLFLTGTHDVERSAIPEGHVLERMCALLEPGGAFAANLITDSGHRKVRRAARQAFLQTFAEVRSVKPPRGLNEVLVGARALAPPKQVKALSASFQQPKDRDRWLQLRYTSLQTASSSGKPSAKARKRHDQ